MVTKTLIRLTPITPAVGALVEGANLTEAFDAETVRLLREAWLDRGVLFFRDQDISEAQLEAFIGYFGTPITEPSSGSYGADPKGPPVHTSHSAEIKGVAERWHADATWLARPPAATALRLVTVPPIGGDTLWANVALAYDDLVKPLRDCIDQLSAVHWMLPSLEAMRVTAHNDEIEYIHPMVTVHPETGRKVLYVSEGWTKCVVGMPPAQSMLLLALLYDHIRSPLYSMRWRWQPGDVALWDNRCLQHFAVPDYDSGRYFQRVVTAGERPRGVGDAGAAA